MNSFKECADIMFKAQMFMLTVNESIKEKVDNDEPLTPTDEQNIDKFLIAYEDILKGVAYFEFETLELFIDGVNDARFILNVNIRQLSADLVNTLHGKDVYETTLKSYFVRLQSLEEAYETEKKFDYFYVTLRENARRVKNKKSKKDVDIDEQVNEIREFMELVDATKLKIDVESLKSQLISADGKSAFSLMKSMNNLTGDYIHAFGYLFIYLMRQLDSGGKLYQGLPTKDNLGSFFTLAGNHISILNFSLKNVLVLLKELKSFQKVFSKTVVYALLSTQFNGFLGVVESYIGALKGVVDEKDERYLAYVKEYNEMVRLYADLAKYQGKRKVSSKDIFLQTISHTTDCAGELITRREEGWHYDLPSIPYITELGVSLKRSLSIYRHSDVRDEFTFSLLLTLLFIYDSYVQNLASRFLTQVAKGEADINAPRESWHHGQIEHFARLRGVAFSDFEVMSKDMEKTYYHLVTQLDKVESLA